MPRRVGNRRRINHAKIERVGLCANCAAQPVAELDAAAKRLGLCVACARSATRKPTDRH